MLKLRKVAVTGGLSSGKTTVCRFFQELGAQVISADEIVHHLLSPKTASGQAIIALLGEHVVHGEKLDRATIAQEMFQNPQKLTALENILHPAVFLEIERHAEEAAKNRDVPLFVAEIPLLFESQKADLFDAVIAVLADKAKAKQRYTSAHFCDDFEQRMDHQLSPEVKAKHADYVLENNGSLEELRQQVNNLFQSLTI